MLTYRRMISAMAREPTNLRAVVSTRATGSIMTFTTKGALTLQTDAFIEVSASIHLRRSLQKKSVLFL
jgi:hypothetical protein